ncbi:zinc ribbon domain-containing protein [Streptomyces avermitilis]|uniref:zinc ribbon domain-containing protein n=1 Tax=Streptomyces avermitilis TaxID=33903 RepID=UPI003F4CE427
MAESAGREVIAVNPCNTSRTCPECGHTAKESRPAQETFHCLSCGPHRARRHGGGTQRSTGRAGPSRRQPGIARSPSRGRSHQEDARPPARAQPSAPPLRNGPVRTGHGSSSSGA